MGIPEGHFRPQEGPLYLCLRARLQASHKGLYPHRRKDPHAATVGLWLLVEPVLAVFRLRIHGPCQDNPRLRHPCRRDDNRHGLAREVHPPEGRCPARRGRAEGGLDRIHLAETAVPIARRLPGGPPRARLQNGAQPSSRIGHHPFGRLLRYLCKGLSFKDFRLRRPSRVHQSRRLKGPGFLPGEPEGMDRRLVQQRPASPGRPGS